MNKLASFNKPVIRALRSEIERALSTVADRHGISLSLGTIRFSAGEFRGKVTGRTFTTTASGINLFTAKNPSPNGLYSGSPHLTANSVLENALDYFGLPKTARRFEVHGSMYTLTSAKLSRPKYPFIGQGPRGGRYRFTVAQVKSGLIK